jgi:hypothetical protein
LASFDNHPHLAARLAQRGVLAEEVEAVLSEGWAAPSREGTEARRFVFPFGKQRLGRHFEEKEVTVYFKYDGNVLIVLTAVARYGSQFPRGAGH